MSVAGIGVSAVCEEEVHELYVQGVDEVDLRAEEVLGVGVRAIFQEQFGSVVMIVLKSVRFRLSIAFICIHFASPCMKLQKKKKRNTHLIKITLSKQKRTKEKAI